MEAENSSSGSEAGSNQYEPPHERLDLFLLALGKKLGGLSFEEMNMLRVRDLLKFIRIFAGEREDGDSARQATQADFDSF